MNYGLNFPVENYAALYISIVNSVDTDLALAKVMPRETANYRSKAERIEFIAQAKRLIEQGCSVRKAAIIIGVKRSTLIWWLKKEKELFHDSKN
ncbi:hypothetical protein [Phascolarctobacterium faecium]|uniref:hypothetical protein n=1 Tax=Phascolarctobacterium faecium TaxID=33025 RepID=UPI0026765F2E|nr:hypothetical protein [Phascolarctobacterium faecium]